VYRPRRTGALIGAALVCGLAVSARAEPSVRAAGELELGYGYDTNLFVDAVPALTHGDVLAVQPAQGPFFHLVAAPRLALRLGGHAIEAAYGLGLRQTDDFGGLLAQNGRLSWRTPRVGPVDLTLSGVVARYLITALAERADSFWGGGGEATLTAVLGPATRMWGAYRTFWRSYPDLLVPGLAGTERDCEQTGTLGISVRPRYGLELLATAAAVRNASNDSRLDLWRGRGGIGVRWQAHPRLALGMDYAAAAQWLPFGTETPIGRSGRADLAARTDFIHTMGAQAVLGIAHGVDLFVRYDGAIATSSDPTVEYRRHVAVVGLTLGYGGSRALAAPAAEEESPARVARPTAGGAEVRFSLRAPTAAKVAVIGDFNGWDAARGVMRRGPAGAWTAELDVGHGSHTYSFIVDGAVIRPPGALRYVPDGFGGENALFVVP
jgi:hypothetical protein